MSYSPIILLFGNIICLRAQQTQLFQLDYRSAAHRSIELDSGMHFFLSPEKTTIITSITQMELKPEQNSLRWMQGCEYTEQKMEFLF